MDSETVHFYDDSAKELCDRYDGIPSAAARYFALAFPAGGRVLDVGCGSGRDLQALVQAGFDATGVDASEKMLAAAARTRPALAWRLVRDGLPNLTAITADGSFDGVLCWAALMHLPEEVLFDTIFNLRRVLKEGGRLLISTPLERPDVDPVTHRDAQGRLFNQVTPEKFQFLLEKVGFRRLNRWDDKDSLGRAGHSWATQLFVLDGHRSGSLDKIEGILNRDKKDATYKLALFRALAELATTQYHVARWLPGGKVSIDLNLIADKWLEYYWPLFEPGRFIPQRRGEKPICQKPVAFRADLEKLVGLYRNLGGLSGFSLGYRSNVLPASARRLHKVVKSRLGQTIRAGPVFYAGGGGSGTFVYDGRLREVQMDADLWREFSVMGHWISDATILRWAELTSEISEGSIQPSEVINQLLTTAIPEREVQAARSLYAGLPDKVCVWTDQPLTQAFDVDHAIPFALWGNNDLWNLLPAACAVNNQKRDRLPTRDLLRQRKDCLVHYWMRMKSVHPIRFEFEAGRLVGKKGRLIGSWENTLFGAVAEAVEYTAIQRGVERWQPGATRARQTRRNAPNTESAAKPEGLSPVAPHLIVNDPPELEKFTRLVPFYELRAAAGAFGPEQPAVDHRNCPTWVRATGRKLTRDMFALRVEGRSMEPKIPDGSICLFRGGEALAGSREGRIVLVALRDGIDPETGGKLTVKRYSSSKVLDADRIFRHDRIILTPLNREFPAIEIESAGEGELMVCGEFVCVIG